MRQKPIKKLEREKFNVREELFKATSSFMKDSPDLKQQLEQKNRQMDELTEAVVAAYVAIVKLMDTSKVGLSTSKDPQLLLQACVCLCERYVGSHEQQHIADPEAILRNVLQNHPGSCHQAEYAARKALQNRNLLRELNIAKLQVTMLEDKLRVSEENCKQVTESATETVETVKDEFDRVLAVLEATEHRLSQAILLQSSTEIDRRKLEIMVEELRRTSKRGNDSAKLEERQLAVMHNQFEQKVRSIEKAYRTWWNDLDSQKRAPPTKH